MPLNVLQVVDRCHPWVGGVERHVLSLARSVRDRGVRSSILTRRSVGPRGERLPDEDDFEGVSLFRRPGIARVAGLLDALRPDLIHLHGARSVFAGTVALLAHATKIPYVMTPHCFYPPKDVWDRARKTFYDRVILRGVLRRASRTISLTGIDEKAARARGAQADRCVCLPNAVDVEQIDRRNDDAPPPGLDPAIPFVLSVARLDPVKRLDLLIETFSEVAPPGHCLVLAGPDAGHRTALENLVAARGLTGRVRLVGPVSESELAWLYRHSRLFVLTSAFEGLPTVVLEAMAYGAPVLASDAGGTASVIRDGWNGYLFRSEDRRDLALKLGWLIGDPPAQHVRGNARQVIETRYSWSIVGSELASLYGEICRERTTGRPPVT